MTVLFSLARFLFLEVGVNVRRINPGLVSSASDVILAESASGLTLSRGECSLQRGVFSDVTKRRLNDLGDSGAPIDDESVPILGPKRTPTFSCSVDDQLGERFLCLGYDVIRLEIRRNYQKFDVRVG